jgi:hypothetical protein
MITRIFLTFCLALGGFVGSAGWGHAQENIGAAALAHNDVSRELSGASGRVEAGDPVFLKEIVRTGQESTTKLVFLDSTNLAVGPTSRVVLDRFVFDPSKSEALAVSLTKGLFRFSTGTLDKSAYSVTTPTASIGVRGTVLDVSVEGDRTRVTLREGRALLCPRRKETTFEQQERECAKGRSKGHHSAHCDCVDLVNVGQTAQVTNAGGVTHASLGATPVRFASLCSGGGALCSDTSYASLNNPGPENLGGGVSPPAGVTPPAGAPPLAVLLPAVGLGAIVITTETLSEHPSLSP